MRDAALARVRSTRRWVIAGAAALTAGFAALVSAVAPGHSVSSSTSPSAGADSATRVAGSALPSMPAPASAGDLGLQSPGQGPTPDQSQPQSVPSQPQPQPEPQPSPAPPSSGGGGVVSGGS